MIHKNLKEYPSGNQIEKVSHWANLNDTNAISLIHFLNRRVFFWIFRKKARASLTIEAAVIIPLFIWALCTLLGVLDCYRIQSLVKTSIHQSAMELGMYAYDTERENEGIHIINSAYCIAYAQAHLPELEDNVTVSMGKSHYRDNTVTLVATIEYKFSISLFPLPVLKFINVSEVDSWVGESRENVKSSNTVYEMVYITESGSVYHTSASCSHIDIKVYETKKKQISKKYDACQKCCKKQVIENRDSVYYTKTGECYHITKNCSSLKRLVRMVDIEQVGNLSMCKRCEKRGKA